MRPPFRPALFRRLSAARLAAACLLCAAGAVHAPAAVVARIPRSLPLLLEQLGGRTVRQAEALLNGEPATVRVLGFSRSTADLARELAQALQQPHAVVPFGTASYWLDEPAPDGANTRTLILPGNGSAALAILLERPPGRPPNEPAWPWKDLTPPPGFEPGFTAVLEGGRIALATGAVDLPGAQARLALDACLTEGGWACATPAAERLATVLYARRGETLLATTLPAADGGPGARIALLRRRPE